MNAFEKLMEKKKKEGKTLSPEHAQAKMDMLGSLSDEMHGLMKHDLDHGLKKVEVASSDKDGLKAGLDKAKELLSKDPEEEGMEDPDHKEMESNDGSNDESDDDEANETGAELIGDQIEHESAEGELSDEDIATLERILAKAKQNRN